MDHAKLNNQRRARRAHRNKTRVNGTAERPRLAVHRTNRFIYAQLIDDAAQRTLAAASSSKQKMAKAADAFAVGETLAKKAAEKKIAAAVFDRRSYRFHGRVKSLAEGAKKGGLKI